MGRPIWFRHGDTLHLFDHRVDDLMVTLCGFGWLVYELEDPGDVDEDERCADCLRVFGEMTGGAP